MNSGDCDIEDHCALDPKCMFFQQCTFSAAQGLLKEGVSRSEQQAVLDDLEMKRQWVLDNPPAPLTIAVEEMSRERERREQWESDPDEWVKDRIARFPSGTVELNGTFSNEVDVTEITEADREYNRRQILEAFELPANLFKTPIPEIKFYQYCDPNKGPGPHGVEPKLQQ